MVGWHHQFNGHEFEETPGDSDGQRSLVCCNSWSRRVGQDLATEQHNNNIRIYVYIHMCIYMYVCTYIYFFFIFFSIMVYYRILNIVPVLYSMLFSFTQSVCESASSQHF